jgi:phage-related holin
MTGMTGMTFKYFLFIASAVCSYFYPIRVLLALVLVLFVIDLATGIWKATRAGEKIQSRKLRWSFGKLLSYLVVMTLTFFTCEAMGLDAGTAVSVVKVEVWGIVYVEGLSIVENMLAIRPGDKFLLYLHYLLSVEFLKFIPTLSNFFKQKTDGDAIDKDA